MLIEQIKFIESGDYQYQINFMYDGKNLQTGNIDKSAEQKDVVEIIKAVISDFDTRRAKSNYEALKSNFEGKSVNI